MKGHLQKVSLCRVAITCTDTHLQVLWGEDVEAVIWCTGERRLGKDCLIKSDSVHCESIASLCQAVLYFVPVPRGDCML